MKVWSSEEGLLDKGVMLAPPWWLQGDKVTELVEGNPWMKEWWF